MTSAFRRNGELTCALENDAVFHLVGGVENVQGAMVMGHDDHSGAVLVSDATKQLHDLTAPNAVQGGRGLVGQHHARLVGQGPGDGDPLLLAPGKHGRLVIGTIGDAKLLKKLQGASACRPRRNPV